MGVDGELYHHCWCPAYLITLGEVKWLVGGYSKQSLQSILLPI